MSTVDVAAVQKQVGQQSETIISFLREIVRHPVDGFADWPRGRARARGNAQTGLSTMSGLTAWATSSGASATARARFVYDSHIDTVGIGNPDEWDWDPFIGKVEKGRFYARGACDEKGSTPPMIYGMAIARELGLLEGWTAYYFGNMEEWCDGIAPTPLSSMRASAPTFVVIGEPTKMQVYRGHKGRVEIEVISRGRSAHAASNHLGDNAIYKVLPVIEGVSQAGAGTGRRPLPGARQDHRHRHEGRRPASTPCPTMCACLHRPPRHLWRERGRRHRAGARPGAAEAAGEGEI
jgi:putative selenium metabolism hydrolase